AEDAFSACRSEFAREQGRPMNDDESTIANRAAYLAVEWSSKQAVDHLVPKESLATYFARRAVGGRAERQRRRLNRREERARVRECKSYIEDHWDVDDGVGFVF